MQLSLALWYRFSRHPQWTRLLSVLSQNEQLRITNATYKRLYDWPPMAGEAVTIELDARSVLHQIRVWYREWDEWMEYALICALYRFGHNYPGILSLLSDAYFGCNSRVFLHFRWLPFELDVKVLEHAQLRPILAKARPATFLGAISNLQKRIADLGCQVPIGISVVKSMRLPDEEMLYMVSNDAAKRAFQVFGWESLVPGLTRTTCLEILARKREELEFPVRLMDHLLPQVFEDISKEPEEATQKHRIGQLGSVADAMLRHVYRLSSKYLELPAHQRYRNLEVAYEFVERTIECFRVMDRVGFRYPQALKDSFKTWHLEQLTAMSRITSIENRCSYYRQLRELYASLDELIARIHGYLG